MKCDFRSKCLYCILVATEPLTKGKELERLPNERRVGCVTVTVQPFKRGVEALFQKCYTGICTAMNTKVEGARSEIMDFCAQSSMAFNQRATSIEDITKLGFGILILSISCSD